MEPTFDSVDVSKLFNSAVAVLVLGSLVQHHSSTLPCDAASVCLPLADRQHCKSLQLSVHPVILCQSFPPIWQDPVYSVRILHPREESHGKDWGKQGEEEGGAGGEMRWRRGKSRDNNGVGKQWRDTREMQWLRPAGSDREMMTTVFTRGMGRCWYCNT